MNFQHVTETRNFVNRHYWYTVCTPKTKTDREKLNYVRQYLGVEGRLACVGVRKYKRKLCKFKTFIFNRSLVSNT